MPRTGKKASPKENPAYKLYENRGTYCTLTDELISQIEMMIKSGYDNQKIIVTLGVPESTWYHWLYRDTRSLKEKVGEWRREYLLAIAEDGLSSLANSKSERIRLDALKFLAERLGKRNYATRSEHQTIDENEGKELEPENKEKIERLLITKANTPLPQAKQETTTSIESPYVATDK